MLAALRRWWFVPILTALVSAAVLAGAGAAASPQALARLSVESLATDGTGMERAVDTAVVGLTTTQVFDRAAESTGVPSADLRSRTRISRESGSQTISITVQAATTARAVAEADAVATAGMEVQVERARETLSAVTSSARDLLLTSPLPNSEAERARLAGLGDALAYRQNGVAAAATQLTLLQPAEASSELPSVPLLAAMGLVGGALAGAAIVLVTGARRGRVRSRGDLQALYPTATTAEAGDLDHVLRQEPTEVRTILVAGAPGNTAQLTESVGEVAAALRSAGWKIETPANTGPGAGRADQQGPRGDERGGPGATVLPAAIGRGTFERLSGREGVVTLLVVELGRSRVEWIDQCFSRGSGLPHLLVVDPSPRR